MEEMGRLLGVSLRLEIEAGRRGPDLDMSCVGGLGDRESQRLDEYIE
jgi:hypothetical protein